ncbi:MAG: hypothetical protein ACTHMD_20055, partial [Flavisolibacter sp.]
MRVLLFLTLSILSAQVISAQEDFEKQFAELTKNKTGIPYGNNKAVGKYYTIRGFKMYAETYGQGQPL